MTVTLATATIRLRRKTHGFGLVDLAVAIALLAALLYFLLDRVLYMQEQGEKAEVEETVRSIDFALRLEAASRMARGPDPQRPSLEMENPVKWLQSPPRHYLGEFKNPPVQTVTPCWYFDSTARQLVYRPNRADHLRIEGEAGENGKKELRFAVDADNGSASPRLMSRLSYAWF